MKLKFGHSLCKGPFTYVTVAGRYLIVGPGNVALSMLNKNGLWELKDSKTVFTYVMVCSEEEEEDGIKPSLFRGLGKPSLIVNPTQMLLFDGEMLVWTDKDPNKSEPLCKLINSHEWGHQGEIYKSIHITPEYEILCPFCGNLFRHWLTDDLYQCIRCRCYFEIDPLVGVSLVGKH